MTVYSEHLIDQAVAASDAGRFDAADRLLRLAVGHSGRDAFVLYGLGHMAYRSGRYADAAQWLIQSIGMERGNPRAHIDLGLALFGLGDDAAAWDVMERGLEMDAGIAMAVMTEGLNRLREGDLHTGWWGFEARLVASPGLVPRRVFAEPRWFGSPAEAAGRTILLHSEQGHGDAIQFARYVPMVQALGANVLLEGHPGLLPLYREIPGLGGVFALNDRLPTFDLQCPLLSLGLAFRTELPSIPTRVPYLSVPLERQTFWRQMLGPRKERRIGIAWSGNPAYAADAGRSLSLALLEPLLRRTENAFHVVQTEIRDTDRVVLLRQPHVRDNSDRLIDFADTAALLTELDLLISVDTSVAHLAGALGIPVWLLLPAEADWRWMTERADSPWYPRHRLFRQRVAGDWEEVVRRVLVALA